MQMLSVDSLVQLLLQIAADLELLVNHLSATCICVANIKEWTSKDPTLSQVKRFILSG